MLIWVRLLLRLMALGCFLLAAAVYLLVAHHAHLTCDRATDKCVLEETRPLRDPRVQTLPLSDVLDASCQSDEWMASPQATTILKQARLRAAGGIRPAIGGRLAERASTRSPAPRRPQAPGPTAGRRGGRTRRTRRWRT